MELFPAWQASAASGMTAAVCDVCFIGHLALLALGEAAPVFAIRLRRRGPEPHDDVILNQHIDICHVRSAAVKKTLR